jgi:nucleoside phosphorylase
MQIDWAIYGERNAGHALLAASGSAGVASRITQFTDRPGDPPVGLAWGPVDSGFPLAEHYILLRTLPDPGAGRAGMVRSYAAFVPLGLCADIRSLAAIFRRLPSGLFDATGALDRLDVADAVCSPPWSSPPFGVLEVAARLGSIGAVLPLVWVSSEPYVPAVDAIWKQLPVSLRTTFAFAFQFAPEHKLPVTATLVATTPELGVRWPREQLLRFGSAKCDAFNAVQAWLASFPDSSSFTETLQEYGIAPRTFSELPLLAEFVKLAVRLPTLSFSEACKAVRVVEKYSRAIKVVSSARSALFAKLCSLASKVTLEEVVKLRNLDEKALDDLIAPLQFAIQRAIPLRSLTAQEVVVLEMAADAPDAWWSKPLIDRLNTLAAVGSNKDARNVLELFASRKLRALIAPALSTAVSTEKKLLLGLPDAWSREHCDNIARIAEDRGWMRLHAASLAISRPAVDAIQAHSNVAGARTEGLHLLVERLGFAAIFRAACQYGSSNLIDVVSAKIHADASVVAKLTAGKCNYWCLILARTVERAEGVIAEPLRSIVAGALNHSPAGGIGMDQLGAAVASRDVSVWFELADPQRALSRLKADAQVVTVARMNEYVLAEIHSCNVVRIANPLAFKGVFNVGAICDALASAPLASAVRVGVSAFRTIPFLSDDDCRRWLIDVFTRTHHVKIVPEDAAAIASLLLSAEFPKAAEVVRETVERFGRSDVAPALDEIRYKYQISNMPSPHAQKKRSRLPKVLIATALPLERSAVVEQLGATEYLADLLTDVAKWPPNEPVFEIHVLTTGAGNLEAQRATLRILNRIKPKLAFFVGIGGGIKDSEIGDVAYSTKIYYYEGGKEEDDGIKNRPAAERTSEALVQLAHRVAEQAWQPAAEPREGHLPKATPAVVASGENVLASTAPGAATFQSLKRSFNDTQIVEMEGYGFLNACRDEDVRHCMVIRGISDKLVGKGESDAKGSQPTAARNAAAFLFKLLSSCPILLKKKRKKVFGLI